MKQEVPSLDKLHGLVLEWALYRGLLDNSGAERQCLKAMSELGELADEILKGTKENQKLELGDVLVTLILTAYKLGFGIDEALHGAYVKIKNRKGTLVNGVFVKEEG